MIELPVKAAKLTPRDANIGAIHVPVYNPAYDSIRM